MKETMMRRIVIGGALCAVLAACGGGGGESAVAVCDDFQAVVDDGHQLPDDWDVFEPVIDRADDVDELAAPASNIRSDVGRLTSGDPVDVAVVGDAGMDPSVTGFYTRCAEAGWGG